ncbi:MAG: hypothetical protein HKO92_03510 [Flavobacteriaceae bacterium]|nr:hypothetical protein [Flavobacteriaceae bacterium]
MKKKLESELISIAHRILKLSGKEEVALLHKEVAELYEKLTVLKFAQDNFEDDMPTIGADTSFFEMLDTAFNNKVSDTVEVEDKVYINLDEVEDDGIMEHVTEKIKDIVAQMPQETQKVDEIISQVVNKPEKKASIEDIAVGYDDLPVFEPVDKDAQYKPKTLNDKLKSNSINIGLNDKIAFVKNLFEGSNEDYERVLSQLNTTGNFEEASQLIQNIVKPDYNNWEGKDEFEERFMEIIQSKFS